MRKVMILGLALCLAAGASLAASQRMPDQVPVDISIISLGKDQGFAFQNTYAQPFYTYDLDQPGKSNCNDHCAEVWVPVYPTSRTPVETIGLPPAMYSRVLVGLMVRVASFSAQGIRQTSKPFR